MKIDPYRLLSFAFASADLFVEVAADGVMGFALGAGAKVCGQPETSLAGRHWREIIAASDQPMIEALLASIGAAERRGPFSIRVVDAAGAERYVSFSLGRLPPLTTVSMSFSLSVPESVRFSGEPLERDRFTQEADRALERAKSAGKSLELSLIELTGLQSARDGMTPAQARHLDEKINGAVRAQSYAGALVGKLGDESYAVVRPDGDSEAMMTERLNQSLRAMVSGLCDISAVVKPFTPTGTEAATNPVLALKRAMDTVARNGPLEGQSLADAVSQSVQLTLTQAAAFKAMVSGRRFKLAYQPVVTLKTERLHHYEILVRFREGQSPMDTILMAEDLDLIEDLDRAILDETLKVLGVRNNKLKLAINISGRSIANPAFLSQLRAAAARVKGVSESLIFEVTESAKIEDFAMVDRHIQTLRKDGHTVCLDDFGAGAASLAYLQRLQVDVVKVDGQYIKTLGEARERSMVGHVVDMCREMGVATIAEMIETEAIADAARQVGFDYGQGYLFGRPTAKPEPLKARSAPAASRRRGLVESWG